MQPVGLDNGFKNKISVLNEWEIKAKEMCDFLNCTETGLNFTLFINEELHKLQN